MDGIAGFWGGKTATDAQAGWFDRETKFVMACPFVVSKNMRWTIALDGTVTNDRQADMIAEDINRLGVSGAASGLSGRFAVAAYDRELKELHLIRDRMGEKSLYYGHAGGSFFFCSELNRIYQHGLSKNSIDMGAVALFFRYGYIPAPFTVFSGVQKLLPGTILKISDIKAPLPEPEPYWSILKSVENARRTGFGFSEKELLDELEELLKSSILGQMNVGAPVGTFLSGGIDSSLITALARLVCDKPLKTFTLGYLEKGYNEAEDAKKIANALKTDHTEIYVSMKEAMGVIPELPKMYHEPFADASQIPTYLVSKLAKEKTAVCLSGDAGDELFGGYNRYVLANSFWPKLSRAPHIVRRAAAGCFAAVPADLTNMAWNKFSVVLPSRHRYRTMGDKLHKLAGIISSGDIYDLYMRLVSQFTEPSEIVLNAIEHRTLLSNFSHQGLFSDDAAMMMALDLLTYLPDDGLIKVGGAAKAAGIEVRAPFLDPRVVEFALRIPTRIKIKDGKTKWPLRQILYKYVPKELMERPKMGFGIPIDSWLRRDLREWGEALLDEKLIREQGILNVETIRKLWKEHLSGRFNRQYQLWTVLMFQSWFMEAKNDNRL